VHILYTNNTLGEYAGSELYVFDMALEMQQRGHQVTCFSLRLGKVAKKLSEKGIAVTSDLRTVSKIDIIHAHHRIETKIAAALFPLTPMVIASLGPTHPLERPSHSQNCASHYIAVSDFVRKVLIEKDNLPPELIEVVPNFVDTARFAAKHPINERPRKVLLLTNYFRAEGIIAEACKISGDIELKEIGTQVESVWNVEDFIEWADVVITSGRGAVQAMAMGRAVVIYLPMASDGLVTPANFEAGLACNFNGQAFAYNFTAEQLATQINSYTLSQVTEVTARVRQNLSTQAVATRLLAVYNRAIENYQAKWAGEKTRAKLLGTLSDLADHFSLFKDLDEGQAHTTAQLNWAQKQLSQSNEREQNLTTQNKRLNQELSEAKGVNQSATRTIHHQQEQIERLEIWLQKATAKIQQLESALKATDETNQELKHTAYEIWLNKNRAEAKVAELQALLQKTQAGKVLRLLNAITKRLNYFKAK
jgi:O-antigen biosynthesis protein